MATKLPKGPHSLEEFDGDPPYANLYAEGGDVFLGMVSAEGMAQEEAEAVGKRWADALSWTEPEILDAPDRPGPWLYRMYTGSEWQACEVFLSNGVLVYWGGLAGGHEVDTRATGGQWTKALPGPGPKPARTCLDCDEFWLEFSNAFRDDSDASVEVGCGLCDIYRDCGQVGTGWKWRGGTSEETKFRQSMRTAEGCDQFLAVAEAGVPPGPAPASDDGEAAWIREDRDALLAVCEEAQAALATAAVSPGSGVVRLSVVDFGEAIGALRVGIARSRDK